MPPIAVYMALAEAMHDEDDTCNEPHEVPFAECVYREYDIQAAMKVLTALRRDGWSLEQHPVGVVELGL